MALYLSKYSLSCITAPMLRAAWMYWRVPFSASAASSDDVRRFYICRRASAFRLSVRFRFAASSLEMLLGVSRSQRRHLQITCTNSSECAAFSLISTMRP